MYIMYVNSVEGLDALRNILPYLDEGFRYAVEVRHRSWFQDLAYNFFARNNMCLVWSQLADIRTPPAFERRNFVRQPGQLEPLETRDA